MCGDGVCSGITAAKLVGPAAHTRARLTAVAVLALAQRRLRESGHGGGKNGSGCSGLGATVAGAHW